MHIKVSSGKKASRKNYKTKCVFTITSYAMHTLQQLINITHTLS